jgi:hypothetical protein
MLELDTRLVVTRVTYRLLRSLKDPAAIEAATRQILPELKALSAKLELIGDVGYREGVGHELVSEKTAEEFEKAWREAVRSTAVDDLIKESGLLTILLTAKREALPSEDPVEIANSPQLTLALLRSAQTQTLSQAVGNRAVRRSPRLAWEALVRLYGDEATLKDRIEKLKATRPENADELLELADKYLAGWRPKEFNDD